jgi:hypothetical protein
MLFTISRRALIRFQLGQVSSNFCLMAYWLRYFLVSFFVSIVICAFVRVIGQHCKVLQSDCVCPTQAPKCDADFTVDENWKLFSSKIHHDENGKMQQNEMNPIA